MTERRRRYSFDSESDSENSSEELQSRKGPRSTVNLITAKQCIPRSPSRSPRPSNYSSSSESGSESGEIGTSADNTSDGNSESSESGSGENSASSDSDETKGKSHRRKSPTYYHQKDREQRSKPYSATVQDGYDRRKDNRRHDSEQQDDSSQEEQSQQSRDKRNGYEKNERRYEESDDDRSPVKATSHASGGYRSAEDTAITNHYSHRQSRKRAHRGSHNEEPRSKRERNQSTYEQNEMTHRSSDDDEPRSKRERNKSPYDKNERTHRSSDDDEPSSKRERNQSTYEQNERIHSSSDDDEPRSKRERNKSTYDRNEGTRSDKDISDKGDYFANSSRHIKSEVYKTDRDDSEEEAVISEDNRRNGRCEEDSRRSKMTRSRKSPDSSDEECNSRRDSRRRHSSYSDKGRKHKHRKSEDIDEYNTETHKRYSKENSRDPISEKDCDYQRHYSGAERSSSSKKLSDRNRHSPVKSKLDGSDQFGSEDTRSGRRSKRSHREKEDRGRHRRSSRERRPDTRDKRPDSRDRRPDSRDKRPDSRDRRPDSRDRRPDSRDRRPDSRDRRPNSRDRRVDSRGRRPDSPGHDRTSHRKESNDQDTIRDSSYRSFERSEGYEHSRDRYWNRFEERKRTENADESRDGRGRPPYQDRSNRRDRRDDNESRERESRPPGKRPVDKSPPKDPARDEDKTAPNSVIDKDAENYLQAKRSKLQDDSIMTKTGGAYIPPARLRMMQAKITDKASTQYQRIAWEALKKSINGLINKVNVSNLKFITCEILQENIVRGRGLLARSIIQAQAASPTFTQVYAALVAIINTKFPQIGELILKRVVIQFRKGFRRNDKQMCLSASRFTSHLVNQQVAHEILALEILTLLLENPTNDSVEVAVAFLKECGQKLTEVSPRGIIAIFDRLRNVLHEGQLPNRTQYIIEVMFAVRKDGFKDHPAVVEDLDLVEEDDQFTHMLTLEDAVNSEDILNVFKFDPEYEENEEKYKVLKKDILDEDSSDDEDDSGSGSGSSSGSESDDEAEEGEAKETIIDSTETNLVALRRSIYLTIQSSLDFEECAHKLLKMELKPGQEDELCNMILDCCAQMRTYEKFFGLLAQRFCMLDKKYIGPFQRMFAEQYETIHRLETNKLRNVAKFFAHLLHTDGISWEVLTLIKLNEEDTTSSSRIFIKILFQELSEYMGLPKLNDRLKDPTLQLYFEGLFPRDTPRNTRFAINFFTSIGQGGLTDELRAHLKQAPKPVEDSLVTGEPSSSSSSSSSTDSSSSSNNSSSSSSESSSSDSSSSDSDDSSSSSEEESHKRSKRRKRKDSKKEDMPAAEFNRKQRHERYNEDMPDSEYNRKQRHERYNEDMPAAEDSRKQRHERYNEDMPAAEDSRKQRHERSNEDMPESEYSRKQRHERYNEDMPESEYNRKQRHERYNEEISRNRHNHVVDDVSERRGRQHDRQSRRQEKYDKRAGSGERGNVHDRNKTRHGRDHSKRDRKHRDR